MEGTLEDVYSKGVEHIFLTKIFENSCPFFLSIGMTYKQYWEDDPTITRMYLKAYELKNERLEWKLWEQGVYVYEALCDVAPILHAFSKKGTKPLPFSDKPHFVQKIEKSEEEKQKQESQNSENERLRAEISFMNWAKQMQKKFKNKEKNK